MRRARVLLLVIAALMLPAIPLLVRPPQETRMWTALLNAGHAPLFGVFALIALELIRASGLLRARGGRGDRLLALVVTAVVGMLVEGAQFFGPWNADLGDAAVNVLGAAAFLLLFSGPPGSRDEAGSRRTVPHWTLKVLAVLLLLPAIVPVFLVMDAYRQRDAAFPVLNDFQSGWERRFQMPRGVGFERVERSAATRDAPADMAARITYYPGHYPGVVFIEPVADWTGYERFVLDIHSEVDHPVRLGLRIDDQIGDDIVGDRFSRRFTVEPGPNRVEFPLEVVRRAPKTRELDLTRIRGYVLFAIRPTEKFSILVDDIRLE